jgi:hypothetical protein
MMISSNSGNIVIVIQDTICKKNVFYTLRTYGQLEMLINIFRNTIQSYSLLVWVCRSFLGVHMTIFHTFFTKASVNKSSCSDNIKSLITLKKKIGDNFC